MYACTCSQTQQNQGALRVIAFVWAIWNVEGSEKCSRPMLTLPSSVSNLSKM